MNEDIYNNEIMCDINLRSQLESFVHEDNNAYNLKEDVHCFKKSKSTSVDLFNTDSKASKVFYAFLETWEQKIIHSREYKNQCRLLAKYQNLKYVWPEDPSYAATICGECLYWVEKDEHWNKGNPWGWHVLLIPKGQLFNANNISNYETVAIENEKGNLHFLISTTEQDDNVTIFGPNDVILDPEKVFKENFPTLTYKKYDDYSDCEVEDYTSSDESSIEEVYEV